MSESEGKKRSADVRGLLAQAGGQFLVGLILIAVGGLYDWWGHDPGWFAVAGALVLMGAPGVAVSIFRAKGGLVVPTQQQIVMVKEETKEVIDGRRSE